MNSSQARRCRTEGREVVGPEKTMGKKGAGSGPNGAATMAPPEDPQDVEKRWRRRGPMPRSAGSGGGITSPTASTAGGLGHLG